MREKPDHQDAIVIACLQIWDSIEIVHRIRTSLMVLFTLTHGGQRPWQFFQANADPDLQAQLGQTLPQYNLASVQGSLVRCLDILEYDLGHLTNGQIQLSDMHRNVLKAVRARQAC